MVSVLFLKAFEGRLKLAVVDHAVCPSVEYGLAYTCLMTGTTG